LTARAVSLRLDAADFFTAVSILCAQTSTFWRPLNPTLIFVAADTQEKRRQYAPEAQQTFALAGAASPEEVTEMLRILREMTGATHIELDTRSRTITIRDTPERLAIAGELIRQVEKARGEVMLEIELLEVDRDTARKLGVQTPSKAQLFTIPPNLIGKLTQANNLSALQTLLAGIFGTAVSAGTTSVSSLIPPLVAVGGGKTTFLLTLPGAALDFSDALSSCSVRKTASRRHFSWAIVSPLRSPCFPAAWVPRAPWQIRAARVIPSPALPIRWALARWPSSQPIFRATADSTSPR
jgi:general secretion pathway protein D